ncbi:MAG TPA: XrtA/PEP-CTERM system histidine kinase PrsK [Verrucomicrobiae bacterium]|nr:XrtA/PEP-CTERM system histidine kinase PrsK [Verrucomicrobiae bacterium]
MNSAVLLAIPAAALASIFSLATALHAGRSIIRWSFAIGMGALAIETVCSTLATNASTLEHILHWQQAKLLAMSVAPACWIFFSLNYARENNRPFFKNPQSLLITVFVIATIWMALNCTESIASIARGTPSGHWTIGLTTLGVGTHFLSLFGAVLVLMNLEHTFRASVGMTRWRIKYMMLGLGVLFAARIYTASQALIFRAMNSSFDTINSLALLIGMALMLRSLQRAGHFEVKIYPSRLALHHSITVFLAGIYLLIVGVFAKAASRVGGDAAFAIKTFAVLISLALLATLLLSDHVRLHLRRFIARHFQRPLHDYRIIWEQFTGGTALCVEQTDFCRAAVKLVSQIFQILSATVWLADEKKENLTFVASTSLAEADARKLQPGRREAAEIIRALRSNREPVDIESFDEPCAELLKRCQPVEFPDGGHRIAVPLIAGDEILGVMTLGDRVGGMPFLIQDFDLLKRIADQIAVNLMNIQLSRRLTQAKELEAFQTMSAFFVHDLKNTASTLSLMLQNLPGHFQNPDFREETLRAVSKTVSHLDDVVSRLTSLRQKLLVHPVKSDLNALVAESLHCLERTTKVNLTKNFSSLPELLIDPAQIQNVVTNLLLNAREAIGPGGKIAVETARQNGWATLSVTDNGCGMNSEFVNRSLFRPFQSTKKQGMGIGMFQSKMILEAHRGKIEVETEPGKGTTFRMFLPIAQEAS